MSEKFERKERRYIVEWFSPPAEALEHQQVYNVSTDYYDFRPARWSKGKKGPKVRVRTYDNGDTFVEVKYGSSKKRKPVSKFLRKWIGKLEYLFTISYERTEYVFENGTRITADRKIQLNHDVYFPRMVVELKGVIPEWWTLEEKKNWSKSKWALGLKSK